jgi:hypothetical protein
MLEAAKALLLKSLTQELRLWEGGAVDLSATADRLHHQGQPMMARAVWDMWRYNEVELMKLWAAVAALDDR